MRMSSNDKRIFSFNAITGTTNYPGRCRQKAYLFQRIFSAAGRRSETGSRPALGTPI